MRTLAAILTLLLTVSAHAADDAQLLLLGTFHFDNPGLDYIKSDVPDVLTPERQKEIAGIVASLKRFNPTKIAVEWPADQQAALDARYAAYREGKHELTRSEIEQLGFRLAKELGHTKLYAVDVKGEMNLGPLMEYAQKNDPAFMAAFGQFMQEVIVPQQKSQTEKPLGATLRMMNEQSTLDRGHRMYVAMTRTGAPGTYLGADQLAVWYERNIRIFANLARISAPGERILVMYGAGHVSILQQLARDMPGMKVVVANEFL